MVVSVLTVAVVPAAAETEQTPSYTQQETVQGSAILHCFDWSFNQISNHLSEIAAAGYTAVQTSPVQPPKDYDSNYTDGKDQWWKLYQPLDICIAESGSWLGTKTELTSLCSAADNYGIQIIVDVVSNHLANNGTKGGAYTYLNLSVDSKWKDPSYFYFENDPVPGVSSESRYLATHGHLGMPELNTGNATVQQRVTDFLKDCVDCGVDGFRFDTAKHIELPDDPDDTKSDYWPTVLNGVRNYASNKYNGKELYIYGEILGDALNNNKTYNKKYAEYMDITDDYTCQIARHAVKKNNSSSLAASTYQKGISANQAVLWAESHDTYMNDDGDSKSDTNDTMVKTWAIVASRADSTALYFARPNSVIGLASTDDTWKSTSVAEVNKFKNAFEGKSEYLSSSGSSAYVERGVKGVVISKLDGAGSVSLPAHKILDGTYTDHVSGNTFTVSNGTISGTVGSSGVAVVYNAGDVDDPEITASKLYMVPQRLSWRVGNERYAMYLFSTSTSGATAWIDMTDNDNDGTYEADVPEGSWNGVIFCRMDGSTSVNNWDNKWNQTVDLFPDDGTDCFTVIDKDQNYTGSWSLYVPGDTSESTEPTTTEPSNTITVYAYNKPGWSKMNVYYWGSSQGSLQWPGNEMQQGKKVFTATIPNDVQGIIFNNGTSGDENQTVDITSGIVDNAQFYINTSVSGAKCEVESGPIYYLVGSNNNWTSSSEYALTLSPGPFGEVQYKLSNVMLNDDDQIKICDSKGNWYPKTSEGGNYTVQGSYTYDIYFRPNRDGGNDWHCNYFYLDNVTPYTIKWYDGNSELLKTDTVTHGETPVYSGDTPTKTPDDSYSYEFNNSWSPQIVPATADADYYAQFDRSEHNWSVEEEVWTPEKGSTIEDHNTPPACELTLRCTDCDKEITVDANVSLQSYNPPGCSESGTADYTASANGVSVSGTYYINATGHTYGEPAWQWAEDHKSATATFTCSANDDTQTVTTNDITIDYQSDKTVYTAYATFNGTEYTNSDEADAKLFAGHSLTLEGDIGVNFFINVSEEQVNSGVTVDFAWVVNGVTKTSQYKIDKTKDYVKDHRYKASCYVAAAEMTYDINASVTINEVTCEETNTYTVKRYADKILTDQRFINNYTSIYGEDKYNKLNTLVKSLLDYGTRAQIVFNRTEPGLANGGTYYLINSVDADDINVSVNDMKSNLSNYGLEYVGSTVIYMTESTLRHYYRIVNSDLFNAYKNNTLMDGEKISYCNGENNTIYYDVKNIAAYNMDISHTLTIGSNSYNYSVLTYLKKAISSTKTTENTKELCKAAYRYYTASKDYFD